MLPIMTRDKIDMKKMVMILAAATISALPALALSLELTPGSMKENVEKLRTTVDSRVTLTGSTNVTDLLMLRNLAEGVTALDMSGLAIEAYTYTDGDWMGQTEFAAGEIPAGMLLSTGVTELTLPAEGAVTIGRSAFADTGLVTVTIPESVKSVGDYAFSDCPALTEVRFANPGPELGKGVFKGCKSLTKVNLWEGLKEIPDATFDGCSALNVEIPASVISVGATAFRGTALTEVDIRKINNIGDYAFAEMPNLTSVTLDQYSTKTVGQGAFAHNSALTGVPFWDVPVNDGLFAASKGPKVVMVNTETVSTGAFAGNEADSVFIGPKVKTIEAHAFRNLSNLKSVSVADLGSDIPETDDNAFSGIENAEGRYDADLYVSPETKEEWQAHPVWSKFNLRMGQTGIDGVTPDGEVTIAVARTGNDITVTSTQAIETLAVYNVSGMKLTEAAPGSETYVVRDMTPGEVVVVRVTSGGQTKIVKVI